MLLLSASAGFADDYPSHAIRFVVPYDAGGGTDITARVVAQQLSEELGQPVVVENRGGASGAVGSDYVAKSDPDGYTILMGTTGSISMNPSLRSDLPYSPLRDFEPVSLISSAPLVLAVNSSLPVKSVQELVSYAKDHPNELNFASGGGSSMLSGAMMNVMADVQMSNVNYKGTGPGVIAVMSGECQLTFSDVAIVLPHLKEGELKALAVTTAERSPLLPEVPTVAESGVPGYQSSVWYGILTPKGTPPEIVSKLHDAIVKAVSSQAVKDNLQSQGASVVGNTPDEFAAFIKDEMERWGKVIKAANLQIQ
jgi:tripartite-type tricarboxylate transporter receptor subunit TctC